VVESGSLSDEFIKKFIVRKLKKQKHEKKTSEEECEPKSEKDTEIERDDVFEENDPFFRDVSGKLIEDPPKKIVDMMREREEVRLFPALHQMV
jgi:hypothetical protein